MPNSSSTYSSVGNMVCFVSTVAVLFTKSSTTSTLGSLLGIIFLGIIFFTNMAEHWDDEPPMS